MITCPWCGTNYAVFQPNCSNCGGQLPLPKDAAVSDSGQRSPAPPPPPRDIADSYAWRLMFAEGWAIAGLIFLLLGAIFAVVGFFLTVFVITAFVGIPFLILGIAFLGGGGALAWWRYQAARQVVLVLRTGDSTEGKIVSVQENYNVRVNGRNPWTIGYEFRLNGKTYQGQVSTLNTPGEELKVGNQAHILYLPNAPESNVLYPHP